MLFDRTHCNITHTVFYQVPARSSPMDKICIFPIYMNFGVALLDDSRPDILGIVDIQNER